MHNIPSFMGHKHVLKIPEVSISKVEKKMSELVTTAWVITVVLLVVSLLVVLVLNTRKQNVKAQNYRGLILFGML
jgi:heme/copper-type cytochrome/quinol oxidase subunit 2